MAEHEFKAGDQVAHEYRGNGVVVRFEPNYCGEMWPVVDYVDGRTSISYPSLMRPRNFLSKIEEEQEIKGEVEMPLVSAPPMGPQWTTVGQQFNEVFKDAALHGTGIMKDGKRVPHSEVFNPDRFQRNAYGQLVDTVTGLSADSEGIVAIKSIKDTVRSMG